MRVGGAAMLACAALAGAADAATMVVRAVGPVSRAYPPGKALVDTARIVLGATDSLTLLDARGTRTLRGPGVFTPASPSTVASAGTGATLAALASSGGDKRVRIGAVRGVRPVDTLRQPNIWFANVGQSATVCVTDPAMLTMWRPGAAGTITSRITGGGHTDTVEWIKGQTARRWPATLPITDGAIYTVEWPGAAATTLRFAVVGADAGAGGLQDIATVLIRHGCQAQLNQFIDTAAAPSGGGAAG